MQRLFQSKITASDLVRAIGFGTWNLNIKSCWPQGFPTALWRQPCPCIPIPNAGVHSERSAVRDPRDAMLNVLPATFKQPSVNSTGCGPSCNSGTLPKHFCYHGFEIVDCSWGHFSFFLRNSLKRIFPHGMQKQPGAQLQVTPRLELHFSCCQIIALSYLHRKSFWTAARESSGPTLILKLLLYPKNVTTLYTEPG